MGTKTTDCQQNTTTGYENYLQISWSNAGTILSVYGDSLRLLGKTSEQLLGKDIVNHCNNPLFPTFITTKALGTFTEDCWVDLEEKSCCFRVTCTKTTSETRLMAQNISDLQQSATSSPFRNAFFNSSVGMVISSTDAELLEFNQYFCDISGWSKEELTGKSAHDIGLWTDNADRQKMLDEVASTGYAHGRSVMQRNKQGEVFDVNLSASRLNCKDNDHVLWFCRELTRKLDDSNQIDLHDIRYQQLVNSMTNGVAVYEAIDGGQDFVFRDLNHAGCRMGHVTRDEVVGQSVQVVFPGIHDIGLFKIFQDVYRTGETRTHPFTQYKDSNIELWVENQVYRLPNGEIVAVYADITERKRLESELLQSHKMEAIGQLSGGIAHDFNNILASMLGFADLAKRTHGNATQEKMGHYLDMIMQGGQRARALIAQMLMFSRPEKYSAENTESLTTQLEDTCNLLQSSLPSTIQITLEATPDLPTVAIQPAQFQQIVMNLCVNARDAMHKTGRLDLHLGTRELPDNPGEWIELSVRDTGTGMEEETIEKIFDPFFTTKEREEGTGLGLTMVQRIVSSHGGWTEVDSTPDQGTEFRVYLPASTTVVEPPASETPQVTQHKPGSHILLVDDEATITEYLAELLQSHGYRVSTCGSGGEALKLFHESADDFHLIITDQTMPKMTGQELTLSIKTARPSLPVIICSGRPVEPLVDEIEALQANRILIKPVDNQELLANISAALDLAEPA